jgi:hypothetical protein
MSDINPIDYDVSNANALLQRFDGLTRFEDVAVWDADAEREIGKIQAAVANLQQAKPKKSKKRQK